MSRVLTYGTFDLFHIGHLRILERAKALGSYLLVGVSTDEFTSLKKRDAIYPYHDRAAIVGAMRCVDEVFPEACWEQKAEDIKRYNASILVMGSDWEGKFDDFTTDACKVVYLPRTDVISSASLVQFHQRKS